MEHQDVYGGTIEENENENGKEECGGLGCEVKTSQRHRTTYSTMVQSSLTILETFTSHVALISSQLNMYMYRHRDSLFYNAPNMQGYIKTTARRSNSQNQHVVCCDGERYLRREMQSSDWLELYRGVGIFCLVGSGRIGARKGVFYFIFTDIQ